MKKNPIRRWATKLRYMSPEHIAEDFPAKREREAIAAVFAWISFNASVARRLKNGHHYSTNVMRSLRRNGSLKEFDAQVLQGSVLEHAKKVLGVKET